MPDTTTPTTVPTVVAAQIAIAKDDIEAARRCIADCEPHRSLALAATKLDEARMWLDDYLRPR